MKNTMDRGWSASGLAMVLAAGLVLGAPALAVAQTEQGAQAQAQAAPDAPPAVPAGEVGHSTAAWLDLQRSGAQAAPALPTLGSEAGLAYKRYMESFKSKIPDLYGSTLGGNGGGGGASAGGSGGSGMTN
jgi:hypothetical protein